MKLIVCLALLSAAACNHDRAQPKEQLEAAEPRKAPAADPSPTDRVAIAIAADGALTVQGAAAPSMDAVDAAVRAVVNATGRASCDIDAAPAVPYAKTLALADRCHAAGAHALTISGVPIELPRAAAVADDVRPIAVVSIAADGTIVVGNGVVSDAELGPRLRQVIAEHGDRLVVLPDNQLATGRVVTVWKAVLAAGLPAIRMMAVPKPVEPPQMAPPKPVPLPQKK